MSKKFAQGPVAALVCIFLITLAATAQSSSAENANPASVPQSSTKDTQPAPAQDSPKKQEAQSGTEQSTQQSPPTNPSGQGQPEPGSATANTQGKVAGTSNDRLFYTLPNFLTLQGAGKLPPLTAKEKFKVVALSTFDPVQYPWWALLSAISQAENSEPAFGQGWAAYGKRYGTTAGDSTVENFMVGAVFPSLLHQDPRFYQESQGGFEHRALYAVSRIVVTRGDSGKREFNFSEVFGAAFAAAVSTYSYHPKSAYISTPTNPHEFIGSERTLSNTTSVWGTQLGLDTITIVVKEFWPDIHRKLSHKHRVDAAMPQKSSQ